MPRSLRPAREERAADDKRHAATNRAHDKVEGAMCANARKTRRTGKHAKDNNAGQPGTANAALPPRSQDVKRAKHYEGKCSAA
jgi:hypothetical protein